jgi:hypothetical protein
MGNRRTETGKWRDSFFRELSADAKLTYLYMLDAADNAGVFDPDWRLAAFSIKKDIDWDAVLEELGNRIERLKNGKIFLTRFILFQYGEISPACAPHRNVLDPLKKHGIDLKHVYRDRSDDPAPARAAESGNLFDFKPAKAERARDFIFEALAEIQGTDIERMSPQERGRLNKQAKELREIEPHVTADRIRLAAKAWKRKGYSAPATAATILSHWSELTPAPESTAVLAERERIEVRLLELSQPAGKGRAARSDLSSEELAEYERLAQAFKRLAG